MERGVVGGKRVLGSTYNINNNVFMKYTLQQLEEKLNKLREDYKTAKLEDRKIIEVRAKLVKRQIEIYQSKKGFI